jgi:hypothetical protein
MPPIDFKAVELKSIERLLEQPPVDEGDAIEPDW